MGQGGQAVGLRHRSADVLEGRWSFVNIVTFLPDSKLMASLSGNTVML